MVERIEIYKEDDGTVDPMGIPIGESETPEDLSELVQFLPPELAALLGAWQQKYNPHHDAHGRFASGSSFEMADSLTKHGGFTMQDHVHSGVTHGKAVSPYPERSAVFENIPTAKDIRGWLDKNKDVLKEPNTYAGGWFDAESKKTFLDISIVVQSDKEARALSEKYKQRAYFDLDKGEEVRVLSESEAHQVA